MSHWSPVRKEHRIRNQIDTYSHSSSIGLIGLIESTVLSRARAQRGKSPLRSTQRISSRLDTFPHPFFSHHHQHACPVRSLQRCNCPPETNPCQLPNSALPTGQSGAFSSPTQLTPGPKLTQPPSASQSGSPLSPQGEGQDHQRCDSTRAIPPDADVQFPGIQRWLSPHAQPLSLSR